ncbi:MAG: serine/threonine-protein kinase [Acidobacteriota bacterium]
MSEQYHRKLTELFLAALDYAPSERAHFLSQACADDNVLKDKIAEMLAAHELSNAILDKPVFEIGLALVAANTDSENAEPVNTRQLGKYQLLHEIGQGGMGVVYQAMRADLPRARPVAVKVLRPGMNTDAIVRRFHAEYQILASLEHPNIARLFDGGTTDNNLPYFVMELVNGTPIDEYCHTHKLSLTERLELFRKVCAAVQYAHSNFIIHRDLKPSNILVTADGTPKLLDFGIAKLIKSDNINEELELTQTGQQLMTPAYASPEQIQGKAITTAVDIYALGILLYKLLTGSLPYQFSTLTASEIERVICEEEPIRPSVMIDRSIHLTQTDSPIASFTRELKRELSGDIDNIILMALRKEPQRRYTSVEQFSQDIRRYLEGFPIIARKDTLSYRISKYVRRNRLSLTVTGLVVLLTIVGATTTFWQASEAAQERNRAEIARQITEARSQDIRELANTFLFKFNDQIENLPGSTSARETLVKESVKYLDRLTQQSEQDRSLQRDMALAYRKVGDVQGRPYRPNVGDTTGALESYQKSLQIFEQLTAAYPEDIQLQNELATSLERAGEIFAFTGNIDAAITNYRKTRVMREKLVDNDPANRENSNLLADCYIKIGDALRLSGDLLAAFNLYWQALEIRTNLISIDPQNIQFHRGVAVAYMKLTVTLEEIGDMKKDITGNASLALPLYQQALRYNSIMQEIVTTLSTKNPNNLFAQSEVAGCKLKNGLTLLKIGEFSKAIKYFQDALVVFERLVKDDPKNVEYHRQLAMIYSSLGEATLAIGDTNRAIALCQKSLSIYELLIQTDAKNTLLQRILADTHDIIARAFLRNGHIVEAIEQAKRSFYIRKALNEHQLSNSLFRVELLRSLRFLTDLLIKTGYISEADRLTEEILMRYKLRVERKEASAVELADYAWLLLSYEPKKLNNTTIALEYAKQANNIANGKNLAILLKLFRAYHLTGDDKNAQATSQHFVSLLPLLNSTERNQILKMLDRDLKRITVSAKK